MANEIKLPALGENVEGGEVVAVKVSAGAQVTEGQPLVEIEAEKSTVEVPSPFAGLIGEVLIKKGDKVKTGQLLFTVQAGNGQAAPSKVEVPVKEKEPAPPKKETPGQESAAKPSPAPSPSPTPQPASVKAPATNQVVPAGPATRRLAREFGVDLASVPGTAPGGRVTQEDVKAFVRNLASGGTPVVAAAGSVTVPALPKFEQFGPVEIKPLESIRKRTAEHMSLAWSLIPHVTQHDLADVTELEGFRRQQSEGKGPKLTVTAFALKAASIMLKQFPQFNASIDLAGGQIVFKNYYNIGVAVDTERGLLVPVLRDVDKKSVHDLARELTGIAEKARDKKLTADDMKGGTFTISNLGGIGGIGFTPIVNWPEVAILGIARARQQPVWKDNQWVPRLMLPLSLSYDHRLIDGADAARFTRRLADMLENPLVMLIHA